MSYGGPPPNAKHAFKVLCPESLISALLGPKGSVKDQIQAECHCKLIFSNRDSFFPSTRLRVLVIYAEEPEMIMRTLDAVVDRLEECAAMEASSPAPHTAVAGEPDFLGKDPGEVMLRCAVSIKASGAIIGPKGANVQAVREECGCRLWIEKSAVQGHQLLKLTAHAQNLRTALMKINDRVQDESTSHGFWDWANVINFDDQAPQPFSGSGPRRRSRSREVRRPPPPASGPAQEAHQIESNLQAIAQTLTCLPESALDLEYALFCELPPNKATALIGVKGEYIKYVRTHTGCSVRFEEQRTETGMQKLVIRGPILSVYRAHTLMMRRYHEDEMGLTHPRAAGGGGGGGGPPSGKGGKGAKGPPWKGGPPDPSLAPARPKGFGKGKRGK